MVIKSEPQFELFNENITSSSTTRVVNIKHTDKYDVFIGRPSIFGNKHPVRRLCPECSNIHTEIAHARGEAFNFYKIDFLKKIDDDHSFRLQVLELRGKVLGCYCKNKDGKGRACHGDIIVDWLERNIE